MFSHGTGQTDAGIGLRFARNGVRTAAAIFADSSFKYEGGWIVTTRGFWAFPFESFTLVDGTSTKNIGIFVFKRAVCSTKD